MNKQLQKKILMNITKDEDSQCWLWKGQISNSGYGKLMIKDENYTTHTCGAQEVSYMAFKGDIPEGMIARHHCSNRLCVNPDHLTIYKP